MSINSPNKKICTCAWKSYHSPITSLNTKFHKPTSKCLYFPNNIQQFLLRGSQQVFSKIHLSSLFSEKQQISLRLGLPFLYSYFQKNSCLQEFFLHQDSKEISPNGNCYTVLAITFLPKLITKDRFYIEKTRNNKNHAI